MHVHKAYDVTERILRGLKHDEISAMDFYRLYMSNIASANESCS